MKILLRIPDFCKIRESQNNFKKKNLYGKR